MLGAARGPGRSPHRRARVSGHVPVTRPINPTIDASSMTTSRPNPLVSAFAANSLTGTSPEPAPARAQDELVYTAVHFQARPCGGQCSCQRWSASDLGGRETSSGSLFAGPRSWAPTGRPPSTNPAGTFTPGQPRSPRPGVGAGGDHGPVGAEAVQVHHGPDARRGSGPWSARAGRRTCSKSAPIRRCRVSSARLATRGARRREQSAEPGRAQGPPVEEVRVRQVAHPLGDPGRRARNEGEPDLPVPRLGLLARGRAPRAAPRARATRARTTGPGARAAP